MHWVAGIVGAAIVAVVLWDAFETVVLPRRVARRMGFTRLFYRTTWRPYRALGRRLSAGRRREAFLSVFGPLSLLFLIGLWAVSLVAAFGLLQYANGSHVSVASEPRGLATDLYLSGTTLFTLGLGDAIPHDTRARILVVLEAGLGFGFLAVVVGYFPVLYQAFSRRETSITLLDARAGSPPSACELLRRHAGPHGLEALEGLLHEWEGWSAELLETHLSYPLLAYYRSQHTNVSWVAALTAILDTCALVMVGVEGACARQARLTFAIARHAVVDLAQIFGRAPRTAARDRLPSEELARVRADLAAANCRIPEGAAAEANLAELRHLYEPYVAALAEYLLQPLPPWRHESARRDNWQATAWDRLAPSTPREHAEHF
jgi:hypothetical protein